MSGAGRNSYDIGVSEEVQSRVRQLSMQIEYLITEHEKNVRPLVAENAATGVIDAYSLVELKFSAAADDVLGIIGLLTNTMQDNDRAAAAALKRARAAVDSIPH